MKELRVGIVGVGGISNFHETGYNNIPGVKITAMCDIIEERLNMRAEKAGIPASHRFLSYNDLINCPDVDALSITTPNNVHYEVAMAAVKAGKPFAVEKPVTNDTASAATLRDAASNMPHMVCFSYRFKHAARYARAIVRSGELGRIYHVNGSYMQAWGMHPETRLAWRYRKEIAGSGALGDLACHLIDLVRFITGFEFEDVMARMDTFVHERKLPDSDAMGPVTVDDYVDILSALDSGASSNLHITRFGFGRGNAQELCIYGEKGALRYSLEYDSALDVCMGKPMGDTCTWARVTLPYAYQGDQMGSFVDIINGKSDGLPANLTDGAINARIVDAVLEAAEKRTLIKI